MKTIALALALAATLSCTQNKPVSQAATTPASTYARDEALENKARPTAMAVAHDFENGKAHERLTAATESILQLATARLRLAGHRRLAEQVKNEWLGIYKFAMLGTIGDVGDHDPLSVWLAETYDKIEAVLGQEICDTLHISDLKIINFGIPVVFHPQDAEKWCQDQLAKYPHDTCMAEYARHFAGTKWVPNAGDDPYANNSWLHHGLEPVAAYWATYAICSGLTWGMGAITFICSPIAMAAEYVSERWIAPPLSDKIYDKFHAIAACPL